MRMMKQLSKMPRRSFLLDAETIEWALEMVQTGILRASLLKANSRYPKSNIDYDPFLKKLSKLH